MRRFDPREMEKYSKIEKEWVQDKYKIEIKGTYKEKNKISYLTRLLREKFEKWKESLGRYQLFFM